MANFDTLKTAIDANIKTNGTQDITGGKMNSILKQMVDATDEQLTELESEMGQRLNQSLNFDIVTNAIVGKYYSSGGTLSTNGLYNALPAIEVSSLYSKILAVRIGGIGVAGTTYVNLCWVKKTDNSYVPLSNYVKLQFDQFWIVELDSECASLEISYMDVTRSEVYNNLSIAFVSQLVNLNSQDIEELSEDTDELKERVTEIDYTGNVQLLDANNPTYSQKYFSAVDTLTEHSSYHAWVINLIPFRGKTVFISPTLGSVETISECFNFDFIKKEGGSSIQLNTIILDYDSTTKLGKFVVPNDATELQYSFDYGTNTGLGITAAMFYYNNGKLNILEGEIEDLQEKIIPLFDVNTPLIDIENPDYLGKYYSTYNTLSDHDSYRSYDVNNLQQYVGKEIRYCLGYWNNVWLMTDFCWIVFENNTAIMLKTISQYSEDRSYAYFIVPEGAVALRLSTDYVGLNNHGVIQFLQVFSEGKINELEDRVESFENNVAPLSGKRIFLYGDSISSADYPWYKQYLEKYTEAEVYNGGFSGYNAQQLASNSCYARLATFLSDAVILMMGTNNYASEGGVGTFSEDSPLAEMGEPVVEESDINADFLVSGTLFDNSTYQSNKLIVAYSHFVRKWLKDYYNFRLAAGLTAGIYDTQDEHFATDREQTRVYPSSGTATESECIAYAATQGWTLAWGERYVMMSTETAENKREKLMSVRHPKLVICCPIGMKYHNAQHAHSQRIQWERKRLAVIEVAEKYGIPYLDLTTEFAIDWELEPYAPGQGYTTTASTDNQGIYMMDGVHPNEFGYEWISRLVTQKLKEIGTL